MRMFVQLAAILSEDDDQLQRSLDIKKVIDDTEVTLEGGGTYTIPADEVDFPVEFASVTNGKYLMILVWSGTIVWKVNAIDSQGLTLAPNPAEDVDPILPYQRSDQPGIAFIGPIGAASPLTALYLSNPSDTTAARVQVAIVGEAS